MDGDIKTEDYSISNNNNNNLNSDNSNINIVISKNDVDDDDRNKHVIHIEDDSPTATTTINSVEDNLVDTSGGGGTITTTAGNNNNSSNSTSNVTTTAANTTSSSNSELRRQHFFLQEQRYRQLQQQRQQQRHVNSRSIINIPSSSSSSPSSSSLPTSSSLNASTTTTTTANTITTTTITHNNYRNNNKHVDKTFGLLKCDSDCVPQEKLVEFLASKPKFNQAVMIRKGRQIMRKDLVGIEEGPNGFLTDIFHPVFAITPSRRCIVVKEDLLCNGEGSCRRKCGGIGDCIVDCPKKTERAKMGHRCSFKVLLTMHSDQIGMWEVKLIGSHVEPEYAWVPPIKKVKWRKVQSHTKALKKALQNRKNSVLQFDWPLKPSFAAEKKETTEFLIQTNSFEKPTPLSMESNHAPCGGLSSSQLSHIQSQMFIQKEEAAFEEFPGNSSDQMVNCNSNSSSQLPVYSTATTNNNNAAAADRNSMVYQKVELCDDYDDYYIHDGGGGDNIIDECGVVVGGGGGVVDDDDDDDNNNDDGDNGCGGGRSTAADGNFNILNNIGFNSVRNNNNGIKTNNNNHTNSNNAVASAASSAAAAAGMVRLLPLSSASAASAAAAASADTTMDFSEAAVGKGGRGSGGGLEEVVEDSLSFEEHLLDFHRAEHEQRMVYMSQEHLAKMEVIALEKDIALLKRQKLVNELGANLKKCDNILLTEQ